MRKRLKKKRWNRTRPVLGLSFEGTPVYEKFRQKTPFPPMITNGVFTLPAENLFAQYAQDSAPLVNVLIGKVIERANVG